MPVLRAVRCVPRVPASAQVAAGAHSCGVVTQRGELYMWGRLLEAQHGQSLLRRHQSSAEAVLPEDVQWGWAGFGADAPTRVQGLGGPVRSVALGGWHALAAVE